MATGNLRPSHEKAWKELWLQSKLEVTGSERLGKALIGCMFYLLSAFPSIHDTSNSFGGVSPGGLSNGGDGQDYWGHVFWDQVSLVGVDGYLCYLHLWLNAVDHSYPALLWQDIWMYPGIAFFYPKLARAVLEYRVRTRDGAKDNAQKQGYKVYTYIAYWWKNKHIPIEGAVQKCYKLSTKYVKWIQLSQQKLNTVFIQTH